jgi:hypothetical protein
VISQENQNQNQNATQLNSTQLNSTQLKDTNLSETKLNESALHWTNRNTQTEIEKTKSDQITSKLNGTI